MSEERDSGASGAETPVILVGVQAGLPDPVLTVAARLARALGADLVCAHVDSARYPAEEGADGSVLSLPVDPDPPDEAEQDFDPALADHITDVLSGTDVRWSLRELAGDPAHAMARLAEAVHAQMIVVGTRDATVRDTMREFFQGSVATHLAHRQHRPVVVVPLNPVTDGGPLPWD